MIFLSSATQQSVRAWPVSAAQASMSASTLGGGPLAGIFAPTSFALAGVSPTREKAVLPSARMLRPSNSTMKVDGSAKSLPHPLPELIGILRAGGPTRR